MGRRLEVEEDLGGKRIGEERKRGWKCDGVSNESITREPCKLFEPTYMAAVDPSGCRELAKECRERQSSRIGSSLRRSDGKEVKGGSQKRSCGGQA